MTLGSWMRNYLYIPLGGNRAGSFRLYFNLWIVFLLSGLWHGASWNFLFWGAWHGFFLVIERLFLLKFTARIGKLPRIALTFLIVTVGWVFFRVTSISKGFAYVAAMFGKTNGSQVAIVTLEWKVTFVLALIFSFFVFAKRGKAIQDVVFGFEAPRAGTFVFMTLCSLLLFAVSLSYVTAGGFNPFIYFRF